MFVFEPASSKARWWNALRFEVISLARGTCQFCHKEPAVQVHHLRYPRGRRENARDLMAVCDGCHQRIHGLQAANDNEEQGDLLEANPP